MKKKRTITKTDEAPVRKIIITYSLKNRSLLSTLNSGLLLQWKLQKQANVTGSFSHISQSVRCLEEPMTREISQFPGVHNYSAIVLGGQAMPTCWGRAGAPFVWVLRIVCTYSLWTPSLCIWDQPPLWNDLLPDVGTHLCLQLLKKITVQ